MQKGILLHNCASLRDAWCTLQVNVVILSQTHTKNVLQSAFAMLAKTTFANRASENPKITS